jgi:hypothetical protein
MSVEVVRWTAGWPWRGAVCTWLRYGSETPSAPQSHSQNVKRSLIPHIPRSIKFMRVVRKRTIPLPKWQFRKKGDPNSCYPCYFIHVRSEKLFSFWFIRVLSFDFSAAERRRMAIATYTILFRHHDVDTALLQPLIPPSESVGCGRFCCL